MSVIDAQHQDEVNTKQQLKGKQFYKSRRREYGY